MRFIHTADLHLGKSLEGRSRGEEQAAVLEEIALLAEEQAVDLVLLAGDIFDSFNPSAEAERLLYAFLHRLCADGTRAVVVIAGNHDQPQRLAAAAPLAEMQGIYIVGLPGQLPQPPLLAPSAGKVQLLQAANHVLTLQLPRVAEPVQVLTLPYCSEARLQELYLTDLADEAAGRADYEARLAALLTEAAAGFRVECLRLVMAHLFLAGGAESGSERPLATGVPSVGGSYGVHSAIFPAEAQYVALGHLHRPQEVKSAIPCVYAGSPLAYSFAEAGQVKSVILGELSQGKPAVYERRPLASGCPLAVWRAQDYAEALSWCTDERQREVWVDLEIKLLEPLSADQLAALREAHPKLLAVRSLLPELEAVETASEELDIRTRFRQFVAYQTGVEASEQLVALFVELLEADNPLETEEAQ